MRLGAALGAAVAALVTLGGPPALGNPGRSRPAAGPVTIAQAARLGRLAYLYGFPLLEFLRVRATETSVKCPDRMGDAPVNSFSNAPRFARPSDRTVVAPNVDTLYSIAHLDLGRGSGGSQSPRYGKAVLRVRAVGSVHQRDRIRRFEDNRIASAER